MKVLELFAGTRSIGKAFEARGHEVFSVEWDNSFDKIDLYADGNLTPMTEYAKFCDTVNAHVVQLIKGLSPTFYFIENPVGGLRKMNFMQGLPRHTVTYCQYGERRQKPTDIWTNHPDPQFRPPCKRGAPCHDAAPRGAKTGTQALKNAVEKARIPTQLCDHIVDICEGWGWML